MLSPEVSDFRLVRPSTTITRAKTGVKLPHADPFVNRLHLVLPNNLHLPTDIAEAVTTDTEYYTVSGLSLHSIFDPDVIKNFVLDGEMTLISNNSPQSFHNNVYISPDGVALLVLNRATFHCLGLEGRRLESYQEQFLVRVELNQKLLRNNRMLTRIRVALKSRQADFGDAFTFAWYPKDDGVCPSSLAKYFDDLGASVEEKSHEVTNRRVSRLPNVAENPNDEVFDVVENWLGAALLDVNCGDNFALVECERALIVTVEGLLVRRQMEALLESVSKYLEESDVSWAAAAFSNSCGATPARFSKKSWHLERKSETIIIHKIGERHARTYRTKMP